MIVRLVTTAVGLFGATILFWAGVAWEHRPAGFASWDVPIWGPLHFRHDDPGGPFAQLAALDAWAGRRWPLNGLGDHFLMGLRRRS